VSELQFTRGNSIDRRRIMGFEVILIKSSYKGRSKKIRAILTDQVGIFNNYFDFLENGK
jgi:hypothetical protein